MVQFARPQWDTDKLGKRHTVYYRRNKPFQRPNQPHRKPYPKQLPSEGRVDRVPYRRTFACVFEQKAKEEAAKSQAKPKRSFLKRLFGKKEPVIPNNPISNPLLDSISIDSK